MSFLSLLLWALLAYFIYTKVIKMYYMWWFYKSQGVSPTGFPLPFIGNLVAFAKSQKSRDEYSIPVVQKYIRDSFDGKIPGMVAISLGVTPLLIVSDPLVV